MEVVLPPFEFVCGPSDLDFGELKIPLVMILDKDVGSFRATHYMLSLDRKLCNGFNKSLMYVQIDVLRNFPRHQVSSCIIFLVLHQNLLMEPSVLYFVLHDHLYNYWCL